MKTSDRNTCFLLVEMQMVKPVWKKVWKAFTKTKHTPHNPEIVILCIYVHIKPGTWIFSEALFPAAKIWKQMSFSRQMDEHAVVYSENAMFYITQEMSYRDIKKTYRELKKCTWLSESSQSERFAYCMILAIWHVRKDKLMEKKVSMIL
jgi:hypothetical protein